MSTKYNKKVPWGKNLSHLNRRLSSKESWTFSMLTKCTHHFTTREVLIATDCGYSLLNLASMWCIAANKGDSNVRTSANQHNSGPDMTTDTYTFSTTLPPIAEHYQPRHWLAHTPIRDQTVLLAGPHRLPSTEPLCDSTGEHSFMFPIAFEWGNK